LTVLLFVIGCRDS